MDGKSPEPWLTSTRWFKKDYYHGKVFFYRLKTSPKIELEAKANEIISLGEFDIFIYESNDIIIDYLKWDL